MKKKRLLSFLLVSAMAIASLAAEMMLPFYEFDFDAFIDSYHQLIVNDAYYPENGTPYYDSLEQSIRIFDRNLDSGKLLAQVRQDDSDALKAWISEAIADGEKMTDEEIQAYLFDPDNMYSAFVAPTTDSAMSFFGHNFLMFYIPEAPLLSPCINFYADYSHLGAVGTVFEGLAGNLVSYYDFKPFHVTFLDYLAARDRSIIMWKFKLDADPERVHEVMMGLTSHEYPNYSFLFYNCSHGFMDMLEHIDETLIFPMDRALSPAMGMRMFDEANLVADGPEFEFPAWNDAVDSHSPVQFRDYYRSISSGETGFSSEEPFPNFPMTRPVARRKSHVSSRFSSLSLNYAYLPGDQHRLELWFKPVFNEFIEQNYVDHEIMNLHAVNGGLSMRLDREGNPSFEGFEVELFSFDSLFPFTTLKKRPSFGADLSLGMRDFRFLAETDFYLGMTLGRSDLFWFFGLDNIASTVPMEYTLNFRNMVGAKFGPACLIDRFDLALFSTLHDLFHYENELSIRLDIVDSLTLKGFYRVSSSEGFLSPVLHGGGVSLIWNFNIF